ncbi:MAG TPA: cell division protein FtsA, partial [Thermoanaerobaculia bacterium]
DPLGMTGSRLEANVHIVTGARTHDQNVLTCVNKAGIEVTELVLEQLAGAEAVLTPDEKEMGVVLMDAGAGTTDYAVFLEGNVVHTNVLPVGAGHFTSDISVVLRTPMDDAERIKRRYGCALASLVTDDDPIEVPTVGGRAPKIISKHELTSILEPRAAEIAKLIYRDLEKVGLEKEIRSGVVVVGGGAEMDGFTEMIEQVFDQQTRKGLPQGFSGLTDTVNGPEWVAATGLLLWGFRQHQQKVRKPKRTGFAKVAEQVRQWFVQS